MDNERLPWYRPSPQAVYDLNPGEFWPRIYDEVAALRARGVTALNFEQALQESPHSFLRDLKRHRPDLYEKAVRAIYRLWSTGSR